MSNRFTYIVAACLTLALHISAWADAPKSQHRVYGFDAAAVSDSLKNELSHCSPLDSLSIMSDLFDVLPRTERDAVAYKAARLALRLNQPEIGLDLVRNLANKHYHSDSLLLIDRALAMKFPKSTDRDETVCFIDILHNFSLSEKSKTSERKKAIDRLVKKTEMTPATDLYSHLVDLHAICLNLSDLPDSQMLTHYINQLDSLAGTLRPEAYALRNLIYVQSSLAYNNSHITRHRRAKFDRKLLAIIDSLENGHLGMKRKYRNYDPNRYILYTRILATYDSLPKSEVRDLYHKAMHLTTVDSIAAATNRESLRPQIYMAMKNRDYVTALGLIKRAIDMPYNQSIRPYMLHMLIEAAAAQNDTATLLQALQEYNAMLEDALDDNIKQRWRELEITYDLNNIRNTFNQEKIAMNARMIKWSCIVAAILVVLLILMLVLFLRSRSLTQHLRASNITLLMQRDHLRRARDEVSAAKSEASMANKTKNALINNLSDELTMPLHVISEYTDLLVDNAQIQQRPYLRRYVDMVVLNSQMLTTLINDLRTLFEINAGNIKLRPKSEKLITICELAIESVQHRLSPGVTIKLDAVDPNVKVRVDVHRLMQILWQLLSNAVKFTSEGTITISYAVNPDGRTVTLSVTDTGIGIAPEYSEKIFEKFVKLDQSVPGAGIGLTLARKMARKMDAKLTLDTTYTHGARFQLTLVLS